MSEAVNPAVSDADIARLEEAACPTCGSCAGMFTANSMNCLLEALGLALPGNGSTLATHTAHRALYEPSGRTVVELAGRYYDKDDASVLPRAIASRAASATPWPWTWPWAAPRTPCCTCSPPAASPRSWANCAAPCCEATSPPTALS